MTSPRIGFWWVLNIVAWSSTWGVIDVQVDHSTAEAAVGVRLLLASVALFGFSFMTEAPQRFGIADHAKLALQGVCLYGLDLILVYRAIGLAPSGLVAIVYATGPLLGILLERVCGGRSIDQRTVVGAVTGLLGVALVAVPPLSEQGPRVAWIGGELYAMGAVVVSSVGAIIFQKESARLPLVRSMAWGMTYGGVFALLCVPLAVHLDGAIVADVRALGALVYLTVVGSLIGFGSFLYLVRAIGLGRAAYTGILAQIIALAISASRHEFDWGLITVLGGAMCLAGNVLVLCEPRRSKEAGAGDADTAAV